MLVAEALEKLKRDPEPEAAFMEIGRQLTPGYKVQTAVDTEHALIVAQTVTTGEVVKNGKCLSVSPRCQP
jgi:hypothetical protein